MVHVHYITPQNPIVISLSEVSRTFSVIPER